MASESDDINLYYEEEEALGWRQPTVDHLASITIPEAVWMVPNISSLNILDILGKRDHHLKRIERYTNTHMTYEESKSRIEIWGALEDVEEALKQWEALAKELLQPKRKKGWAKPEKAPINEKQEKKLERRKTQKLDASIYKKRPKSQYFFPFNGYFIFPDTKIPIDEFIGPGEIYLNPVRIETKCHIWRELMLPSSNVMKIVGDSNESVETATERVKNMFIKVLASKSIPIKGWILHMLEPPRKPYKVRIADPPPWFHLPYDETSVKLFEPVHEGERIPVVGKNDTSKELNVDFDALQEIRESNIKRIEESLVKAFETVHLFNGEIKSRIRFGHICFKRIRPLKDFNKDDPLPIDIVCEKILKNNSTTSKFATCLATEYQQLERLSGILSEHRQEWDGSPFREFKIRANRKVPGSKVPGSKVPGNKVPGNKVPNDKVPGSKVPNNKVPDDEEVWPCSFDIQFEKFKNDDEKSYDGRIGLWNAVVNERNLLDINMFCADNDYSWKLNFKTAQRLPNSKSCAQGTFVHKLRLCPKGRLVYSNTKEIKVISVCEKTKWKYWWNNDYVVEITKYEFWNLPPGYIRGVEILLSQEKPPKVSYGVTLYKKSWHDHFAINSNLNTGEAPDWHPHDIMNEKETGSVKTLLNDIRDFLNVLQSNFPMPTPEELYGID